MIFVESLIFLVLVLIMVVLVGLAKYLSEIVLTLKKMENKQLHSELISSSIERGINNGCSAALDILITHSTISENERSFLLGTALVLLGGTLVIGSCMKNTRVLEIITPLVDTVVDVITEKRKR